ncbi:MAG: response regulator, partial [Verrucomicrobia bacterium]|nr:response regulator [Verrucomicrobiota bacterium]
LLDWYTVSIAILAVVILAAHGATYLTLKTEGAVHDRCEKCAKYLWIAATPLLLIVLIESRIVRPDLPGRSLSNPFLWLGLALIVVSIITLLSGLITRHTFSYTPIQDDAGKAGGIICANTDDTQRVIGERQLKLLRNLATVTADLRASQEVYEETGQALSSNAKDLPFSLLYVTERDGQTLSLVGTSGITRGDRAAPNKMTLATPSIWPVGDVMRTHEPMMVESLPFAAGDLPTGAWTVSPCKAALLPINVSGRGGVLIVGLNPYRLFDEGYRGFLSLVAGQVSAAIAVAEAYEDTRRRAEALAELDRAKTTFFSNISHEFRTPLTLTLGPLLDTIAQRHGPLQPRVAEELTVVHRNGQRLLKLVNTLLEFSRIEAGRVQASFAPTDLVAFTTDLASAFRSAIEQAGLTLDIEALPLPEPAYVDRDMWEKIVLNLISNAFKFTLEGGITVRVDMVGTWMRLIVEDSGCGIPEEELPRLFERFHRVQSSKGRTHEGTGIGLALVAELVKIHHGQISVESELEKGSRFIVSIPAGKGHLPPEQIITAAQSDFSQTEFNPFVQEAIRWLPGHDRARELADGPFELLPERDAILASEMILPTKGDGTKERSCVLVADDNADMRDYLRRLLAEHYDVLVAADGRDALDKARGELPTLILSDVMMPNMDGFELLRTVRADSALAAVPVILLSARAGEDSTLEGIRAGANDYLIKPFGARELLARVEAQIQRKRFEKELNAAEQRLQAALAAVRMVAWEWDPITDKMNASPTSAEVFGLRPGERLSTGEFGFALVHPDDRDRHRALVVAALERGENFGMRSD